MMNILRVLTSIVISFGLIIFMGSNILDGVRNGAVLTYEEDLLEQEIKFFTNKYLDENKELKIDWNVYIYIYKSGDELLSEDNYFNQTIGGYKGQGITASIKEKALINRLENLEDINYSEYKEYYLNRGVRFGGQCINYSEYEDDYWLSKADIEQNIKNIKANYKRALDKINENKKSLEGLISEEQKTLEKQAWIDGRDERIENEVIALRKEVKVLNERLVKQLYEIEKGVKK